jgi:malate dehydrogenase (quinone)
MLHLMEKVFKDKVASPEWQAKLKTIIPSYGTKLNGNVARRSRSWNTPAAYCSCNTLSHRLRMLRQKRSQPQPENKPVADIAL